MAHAMFSGHWDTRSGNHLLQTASHKTGNFTMLEVQYTVFRMLYRIFRFGCQKLLLKASDLTNTAVCLQTSILQLKVNLTCVRALLCLKEVAPMFLFQSLLCWGLCSCPFELPFYVSVACDAGVFSSSPREHILVSCRRSIHGSDGQHPLLLIDNAGQATPPQDAYWSQHYQHHIRDPSNLQPAPWVH